MRKILLLLCVVVASPAMAKDFQIATSCANCQPAFKTVAEDLVAATTYKAMGPAEATGVAGVGIGLVGVYVPVSDKNHWAAVTGSTNFSGVPLAGLQVTKGLPLNIDVGAFYTKLPGTNASLYGAEGRYAFLPGSTVSPAIALRGSYTKLTGVDDFSLDSKAADLELSKGIGPITPYVGVGYVWGSVDPSAKFKAPPYNLSDVKDNKTNAYIGARFSAGLLEFTPEIATVGGTVTYGARFGFSFSLS